MKIATRCLRLATQFLCASAALATLARLWHPYNLNSAMNFNDFKLLFALYMISPYIGLERLGSFARGRFWTTTVYLLGTIVVILPTILPSQHLPNSEGAAVGGAMLAPFIPLIQWFPVLVMAGIVLGAGRLLEGGPGQSATDGPDAGRSKPVAKLTRDDDPDA